MINRPAASATVLAIDALATHRLTRLMVEDSLTEPLRNKFWEHFPPDSGTSPGTVLTCPHCSSVWAAFAVTLSHTKPFRWTRPLIYSLALADFVTLVHEYGKKPGGWG